MDNYHFYMQRVTQNDDGQRSKSGKEMDLEADFLGLKYKSLVGANAYGKPKGVYAETIAEDPAKMVWVDPNGKREQTDITLTVYFLDPNKYGGTSTKARAYDRMCEVFHDFVAFLTNNRVIYHDTARNKYLYMYMEEAPSLPNDRLKGLQYMEVQFKFKNIYGQPFDTESEIKL